MHPILLRVGPLTITSYGTLLAVACLLVAWLAPRVADRVPHDMFPLHGAEIVDWIGWAMIGGLVGGRLVYVVLNWELYRATPWSVIALWEGGLVWYGGFLGGLAASLWYFSTRGHGWLRSLDQVIPFVALGHAIGRIGCFFNGCCLGKPTEAWFGVCFPGHTERVIPTQLLESLGLLALYVWLRRRQRPACAAPGGAAGRPSVLLGPPSARAREGAHPGAVFASYLIAYGMLRWMIEWRRDNPLFAGTGWTFSQWVSVGIVVAGLGIWWRSRRVGDERGAAVHR